MKLAFYSPGFHFGHEGGIATYTRHLGHALSALGHEVHVLTPGLSAEIEEDGPVTLHRASATHFPLVDRLIPGAGASCRVGAAMRRLVARYGLDLVEFPNWEGFGVEYSFRRSAPLVVRLSTTSRESAAIDGDRRSMVLRWDVRREKWLSRMADTLITHSDAHRQRVAGEIEVDTRRIEVVPLGVPAFPDFQRPPRQGDDLAVVYLGRMERRKGTLDLLHAIPEVVREMPRVKFVLIGSDRPHCPGGRTHVAYANEELPAEARARIQFAGRLPDGEVDRWLQSADLFVAPSLYESFGLIFLEAMRWGTPVVGTRAGAIPEVVGDGETGLLVAPGSPTELAGAIVSLLRDEDRRRRLGEAARRRVETSFTFERMARHTADLYARTIEGRGATSSGPS